jgi:hypothetical protein
VDKEQGTNPRAGRLKRGAGGGAKEENPNGKR